jgi:Protein of unknown function (DUF3300)
MMLLTRKFLYLVVFVSMTSVGLLGASAQQNAEDKLGREKLEQLVAPIALYPDALLSQVLMASTYPLEIVQAARWSSKNPKVKGTALENAMQQQTWDASVKSLTAFPDVLRMMNDKLDWTQDLGNAFLAQQQDLLAAVQTLRLRAEKAGNLKSTKQQKVTKSTKSGSATKYIVIEPASPKVVYVPAYNPTIVYGTWPYPAYPPYYYYPPGYVAGSAFWFATGVAVGSALWGNCNWGRNEVNININRYNQFNRTNINNNRWQHNSVHRKGVPYANRNVANRYGPSPQNVRSREQFRGRAEAGRKQLSRTSTQKAARQATKRKTPRATDRSRKQVASRGKAQRRTPHRKTTTRRSTAGRSRTPPRSTSRRSSAYSGVGSGRQARQYSSRGRQSRGRGGGRRASGGRRR